MPMSKIVELDVRPMLRAGEEPFAKIMQTIAALGPGEGLRLFATFKPTPLLVVLESKGFTHETTELGGGEWEVVFRPTAVTGGDAKAVPPSDSSVWPNPAQHLDNRDLDPPEPMVRILAAIETMKPGEVLSALLCREPTFLLPELAKRGHRWRGAFEPDGTTYKISIKVGAGQEAAA
jgi:uncharacterized protein (DUF2249 family)